MSVIKLRDGRWLWSCEDCEIDGIANGQQSAYRLYGEHLGSHLVVSLSAPDNDDCSECGGEGTIEYLTGPEGDPRYMPCDCGGEL